MKVGRKRRGRKRIKGERKASYSLAKFDSIIGPRSDVLYSCTAYFDVFVVPYLFVCRVDALGHGDDDELIMVIIYNIDIYIYNIIV